MFGDALLDRSRDFVRACTAAHVRIATAESCTGGLVAALLTEIPGSSAVLDRGFVTYSNAAKIEMLGVDSNTIATYGAVSSQTALAMAAGALTRSGASIAVSITGIAGPGGQTSMKPIGLVYFGIAHFGASPRSIERRFGDIGRTSVRFAALDQALSLLEEAVAAAAGEALQAAP